MPIRAVPLVKNETYHIFNRGLNSIPIFSQKRDYQRFIRSFLLYQNHQPPIKFSQFKTLSIKDKNRLWDKLRKKQNWQVEIIAYCLMPNHFHFLLKQLKEKGITNFIHYLSNSYSHYFNIKYKRKGGLFEGRFKAIRVETNEQLLHLSRYIHLNPYSSFVVKELESVLRYPYSSLQEYLQKNQTSVCQKAIVLDQFSNPRKYEQFVVDQADYQRTLDQIKHQTLE